jgi:DNA-binding MarR family transcriptional regulator
MNNENVITDLILETFRLNGRLLVMGDAVVEKVNLTSARWQVLGAIALSSQPLAVAHIGRNMGLTRQAVQRQVNEMARDGLVKFATNPYHKRAKLVLLTTKGKAAYEAATDAYKPWAGTLADGLSARKIGMATDVLRIIRERIDVMRIIRGRTDDKSASRKGDDG